MCLRVSRAESELGVERAGLGLFEGCLGKVQEKDLVGKSEEVSEGRCRVCLVVILGLTGNYLLGSRECRLCELSRLDSTSTRIRCFGF